jgi:ribosomal-protein-alanine N-acetyltransferase
VTNPEELHLVGERVVLRPPGEEDPQHLTAAGEDEYLRAAFGVPPAPEDSDAVRRWLDGFSVRARLGLGHAFVIADPTTDRAVGQIGLFLRDRAPDGTSGYREALHGRASLSYWIVPPARRLGYATTALTLLSDWALEMPQVHRLELFVEPWNEASWRAASRAGYEREGLLRSWQPIADRRRDVYIYSRIKA